MHTVGLHSALAIKRQRKRRTEHQRAKERRYSSQSGDSGLTSPRASMASLNYSLHHHKKIRSQKKSSQKIVDSKGVTSNGILHIGVVFLILGLFLLISGIFPNDLMVWKSGIRFRWLNELVVLGIILILGGGFLIIFNRIIVKKEENNLEFYVKQQLTRSKSGHRLERDIETGELSTKQAKRAKQFEFLKTSKDNSMCKDELKSVDVVSSLENLSLIQDHMNTVPSSIFVETKNYQHSKDKSKEFKSFNHSKNISELYENNCKANQITKTETNNF